MLKNSSSYVEVLLLPSEKRARLEVEGCITVSELLKRLGLSREQAVAVRGGEVLAEWDRVCSGEQVDVYVAVSGG